MTIAAVRPTLDQLGYTNRYVQLPGEQPTQPPVEGALRIVPVDAQDQHGQGGPSQGRQDWALEVVDYGAPRRLATARSEDEAVEMLRRFLNRPFPAARDVSRAELDGLRDRAASSYPQLAQQVHAAGPAGLTIQIPAEVPVDRLGGPDGYLLHPLDTPVPTRSLPPTSVTDADVHRFVVTRPFLVAVRFVQPWFGQPGGALRFTIADPALTVRDLVVDGSLTRLRLR
ncbi:TNT domain-containing protein [Curtobacterium sp. RRHDQ10]|uniref:TNT domain-containing protein n=1 Tax=Curtobacterium phyllosphaerae TaxID=3413379 RepID=UPI003BF26125